MADALIAIRRLFRDDIEGTRFSDVPTDMGGATKYGISLIFLRAHHLDLNADGIVNEDDIRSLTQARAEAIYRQYFWKFADIPDQSVANKLMDVWVNMKPKSAALVFQKALNWLGYKIALDGILGPITLQRLVQACALDSLALLKELRVQQALHYFRRVVEFPPQAANLAGWLRRTMA